MKRKFDPMANKSRGPIPLPEGDVPETTQCISICIPSGAAYKRQLFGALYELTHWNNYERDDTHKGTLVAQAWRKAILEGMLNCYQFKIIDGVPAFSNDGGATWTPVPAVNDGSSGYDPRTDAPLNPLRTGSNIPCLAAANATACFVELHREIVEWYDNAVLIVLFCGAISAILQLFFGVGWLTFQLTVDYMTYVNAILGYSGALTNASFTSTIQDELTCIFNCRADENGRWGANAFADVLTDISLKTGDMWRLIEIYVESIGGYVGLNNAGTTTSIATYDCTDCGCGWCRDSDFSTGSSDGWSAYVNTGFNPSTLAVWSGTRWDGRVCRSVAFPDNYWTQCHIKRGAIANVTRIEIWFAYSEGNNTDGAFARLVLSDDGGSGVLQTYTDPTSGYIIWTGTHSFTDFRIRLEAAHRSDNTPTTGYCYITRVKIQGTGSNPLGGDNCA